MRHTSIVGVVALVVVIAFFQACGSSSPSAPTPTPTPTPTTGTLTIKGSTSLSGGFSLDGFARLAAAPQMLPGTPTSVKVKTYKVYLAANADCSNPQLIQDKSATADYQDFTGRPTLFSASVTAGSYNCVAIKINDVMKFAPDATAQAASSGVCVAGRETQFDILKVDDPVENWYDVESGGTTGGQGSYAIPVSQDVFLFITTNRSAVTATNPRVDTHQLVPLANPLVITASQTTNASFVFDFANRMAVIVDGLGTFCWLEGAAAQFVGQ